MTVVHLLDGIYHSASSFIWMEKATNGNVPAFFNLAPVVCHYRSNH